MSLIIPNTIKTRLIFVWTALAWASISVSVRALVSMYVRVWFYSALSCSALIWSVLWCASASAWGRYQCVFLLIYIVLSRIKRIIWIKLNGIKMTNKTCVKLDNLEYWHWQVTLTLTLLLPLPLTLTLTQLHTLTYVSMYVIAVTGFHVFFFIFIFLQNGDIALCAYAVCFFPFSIQSSRFVLW